MVLRLKTRESRSPPGLPTTTSLRLKHTNAGWSSPVARQAHNLKVIGSNPIPATKYINPETHKVDGFFAFRTRLRKISSIKPRPSGHRVSRRCNSGDLSATSSTGLPLGRALRAGADRVHRLGTRQLVETWRGARPPAAVGPRHKRETIG